MVPAHRKAGTVVDNHNHSENRSHITRTKRIFKELTSNTTCVLASIISPRDIARSGFTLHSKVSDVIVQGLWVWPPELLAKYQILNTYTSTINNDTNDCLEWHDRDGKVKKFFVSQVWSDIRHRDSKVDWYHMVWFPSGIPRHAINLWLIVRRKLKTQDMISHWDISNSLGSGCAGLHTSPPNIYDIILSLMPTINRRNTINVVAKLVVASSAYYVWQERNWRLFKKGKRTLEQLVNCIKLSVRFKLMSCKFKKSKNGERMVRL
nr:hypothetical protein [Tanacetum cinerariifolium]